MGKYRKLAEMQQEAREADDECWVKPQACMVCGKVVKGAYGMWNLDHHGGVGVGWTCSAACETTYTKGENRVYIEQAKRQKIPVGMAYVPELLSDAEPEHRKPRDSD